MAPQPNSPDPSGTDSKVPPAASHSGFGGQIGTGQSQSTHGLGSAVSPVQNSTTPEKPATTSQDPAILNVLYPGINLPKPKDEQPQRPSEKDLPAYNPNTVGLVPPAPQPAHTLHSYDPSTGAEADVTIPAQKPAAASDPYAASKVRLADVNGQPRYAVLNAAGEYLFTIDANGNRVAPANQPNSADSTKALGVGAGAALATGATQLGTAEAAGLTGAELGAMVLEGAELGGAIGAVGGEGVGAAPGAVIGAAASLVVGLGLMAGYWYESSHGKSKTTSGADERIDPNSLPDNDLHDQTGGSQPKQNVVPPVGSGAPAGTSGNPDTTSGQILFPSAIEGQPWVPVDGTQWQGGALVWPKGNAQGMRPGFAENPNTTNKISLSADLFYRLTWSGKLEDVDEKYRPQLAAMIAFITDAQGFRDGLHAGIQVLATASGADIDELTGGSERLKAELAKLIGAGKLDQAGAGILQAAVKTWWKASAPIDSAKEMLGQAGAMAVLKSDGWEVNLRPKGGNKHDLVAYKDGQLMIVESKGGNPGSPHVGKALLPDGAGGQYLGEQMTDPYLWHKLAQDAANDPEFRQWLIDRGMLEAVQNEDASKIGYRLVRTDTNGKIAIYGATQNKKDDKVPGDVEIGKTTGNPPGTPEGEGNPGPTLHGVALPIPVVPDAPTANPIEPWIADASRVLSSTLQSLSTLIPPVVAFGPVQRNPDVEAASAPTGPLALNISCLPDPVRAEARKVLGYGAAILR